MIQRENPANPGTDGALIRCAGRPTNIIPINAESQWEAAREMERRSLGWGRSGLAMRGADRFVALALASTYAIAARDTALIGASA